LLVVAMKRTSMSTGTVGAHRGDLLLLDGPQKLALEVKRHFPDLVEEKGAPVGHLEVAPPMLAGPGEGAFP
jgi:hypothetical protein